MRVEVDTMNRAESQQVELLIREVIADLSFYSDEAKAGEIAEYSAKRLCLLIEDDPLNVAVAKESGKIVGFCISWIESGVIHLAWYGVRGDARGRGVGRALLEFLDKSVIDRGAHKISCDTRTENLASNVLLMRCGYLPLSLLRNHWYGQDFIFWEKTLRPDA